jgi:hypothetical protein
VATIKIFRQSLTKSKTALTEAAEKAAIFCPAAVLVSRARQSLFEKPEM